MCIRDRIKGMIKRRFGRIIFITSIIGHSGNAGQSNYSASKAALTAFSKSIAAEVASRGITCNCIAPGYIKTPMTDKLNENQQSDILKRIPVARLGAPNDVAYAASICRVKRLVLSLEQLYMLMVVWQCTKN